MMDSHSDSTGNMQRIVKQSCNLLGNTQKHNNEGLRILKNIFDLQIAADKAYIESLKKIESVAAKNLATLEDNDDIKHEDLSISHFIKATISVSQLKVQNCQNSIRELSNRYMRIISILEDLNSTVYRTAKSMIIECFALNDEMVANNQSSFKDYQMAFENKQSFLEKNKYLMNMTLIKTKKDEKKWNQYQKLIQISDGQRSEYNISYISYQSLLKLIKNNIVPSILKECSECYNCCLNSFFSIYINNEESSVRDLKKKINLIRKSTNLTDNFNLTKEKWLHIFKSMDDFLESEVELLSEDNHSNLLCIGADDDILNRMLKETREALDNKVTDSTKILNKIKRELNQWKSYCDSQFINDSEKHSESNKDYINRIEFLNNFSLWISSHKDIANYTGICSAYSYITNARKTLHKNLLNRDSRLVYRRGDSESKGELLVLLRIMVSYISNHGVNVVHIFKQPSTETELKKLKEHLAENNMILHGTNVHTVANLLKSYLLELRRFISRKRVDKLDKELVVQNQSNDFIRILSFIEEMGPRQKKLFIELLCMLKKIADNSKVNRMNSIELGKYLYKPLFKLDENTDSSNKCSRLSTVLSYMINHAHKLKYKMTGLSFRKTEESKPIRKSNPESTRQEPSIRKGQSLMNVADARIPRTRVPKNSKLSRHASRLR